MLKFSSALFAALAAAATLTAAPSSVTRGRELLGALPLRFEANQGQWPGDIRFAARAGEHGVILTDAGVRVETPGEPVRILPVGASKTMRLEPGEQLRSGSTYLLGRDRSQWQGNVPHYASVVYRGVYPGIDLLYKGTGRKLEYDFIVAPGADASSIRLRFEGAAQVSVAGDGELSIRVSGGEEVLRQPLPFAFQENAAGERQQVAARYRLAGRNEVEFTLGAYDRARTLTIDPVLVATYFGGDNTDIATAVAIDVQGQVWVTGHTTSATLPLTDNPYSGTRAGNQDIFIAKFNPDVAGADSLVWSTYVGGDKADKPTAIALSSDGFVYITGDTMSTNFPLAGTPAQGSLKGDTDAFLIRISRTQQGTDSFWYGSYFGGDQRDYGTAIAVDAQNRPYVAGYSTFGEGFTYAGGSFQAANRGGYDAFFAVFRPDSTSTLVYSTFLGGTKTDVATGIAVDAAGIVHLTGYTMSDDFPATGDAYRTTYAGRGDIFYARADITRQGLDGLRYATYIGGADADISYGMAADAQGRLYLTGYTFSTDFPLAGPSAQTAKSSGADAFLMRLTPAAPDRAALINYATYLGGSGAELGYGIAVSPNGGAVAVTGYTDSTNLPVRGEPLQPRFGGGIDAFLAIFDTTGANPSLAYSSYVGGDAPDAGYHVTADARGNFYMVGSTTSRRLATANSFQPDLSRFTDGFLVRFNLCPDRAACAAQGLIVPATAAPGAPNAAAATSAACVEPGGLSLTLDGADCAATAEGTVLCSRKICSPSAVE